MLKVTDFEREIFIRQVRPSGCDLAFPFADHKPEPQARELSVWHTLVSELKNNDVAFLVPRQHRAQ